MKVNLRESFQNRLVRQFEYIAADNPSAARKFAAFLMVPHRQRSLFFAP